MFSKLAGLTALVALVAAQDDTTSYETSDNGAAFFMWPDDSTRAWTDTSSNLEPCGSSAGVGERQVYPLTNGRLALIVQGEGAQAVHIAVSYSNDPQSNSDFEHFFTPEDFELTNGHTCIPVPDSPAGVIAGDNATFQITYVDSADAATGNREVHYACTDVTFVEESAFDEGIPCFNASRNLPFAIDTDVRIDMQASPHGDEPAPVPIPSATEDTTSQPTSASDTTSTENNNGATESDSSDGPAIGTIAGAIVGSLGGVSLIVAAIWFVVRRNKKQAAAARQADAASIEEQPEMMAVHTKTSRNSSIA